MSAVQEFKVLTGHYTMMPGKVSFDGQTLRASDPVRTYNPDPRHPLDENGSSYIILRVTDGPA